MWQNLVVGPAKRSEVAFERSVHLAEWPAAVEADVDLALSRRMQIVRDVVSIGLRARMDWKVKVRQPLRVATIVLNDERDRELLSGTVDMIRDELNVLQVVVGTSEDRALFGATSYKPNFRSLGQRGLGKVAQELKRAWASPDARDLAVIQGALKNGRAKRGDVEIVADDVEVSFAPKAGFAAASDRVGSVFLDTSLDDELRDLGLLRELQSRIQALRKELGLEYTDRIRLSVIGSTRVRRVVETYRDVLAAEVLASEISTTEVFPGADVRELVVEEEAVRLGTSRA
jgi:isoleucyl-tRNA synthetase